MKRLIKVKVNVVWIALLLHSGHFCVAQEVSTMVSARADQSVQQRTPLSLFIAYHRKSYGEGVVADINIDNGAISYDLASAIEGEAPAILVNGVVAYPLIFAALYFQNLFTPTQNLSKEGVLISRHLIAEYKRFGADWLGSSWIDTPGRVFLDNYTPYLVKAPDMPGTTYADDERPLSHERFVLFVRNNRRSDVEQALNMSRLKRVDVSGRHVVDGAYSLLEEIKNHHENSHALAATIKSIFNTKQTRYSWNIIVMGHGMQMKQLDTPLLARGTSIVVGSKAMLPVEMKRIKTEFEAKLKTLAPDEAAEQIERMKKEFANTMKMFERANKERADEFERKTFEFATEGVIANMPPRQMGLLLDFFNTLPVNIVIISTCYGGGYNAELIEQELGLFTSLTQKSGLSVDARAALAKHYEHYSAQAGETEPLMKDFLKIIMEQRMLKPQRPYILVSQAAFDAVTYGGNFGEWLQQFDRLFGQIPPPSDIRERLEAIMKIDCINPPIILMPDSTHFELFAPTECLSQFVTTIVAGEKMLPRSIDLVLEYTKKHPGTSDDILQLLYEEALRKNNKALIVKMIKAYPTARFIDVMGDLMVTLLTNAIRDNESEVVNVLLDHMADVNAVDEDGESPLICALKERQRDTVKKLLARGAAVTVTDNQGNAALLYVASYDWPDIVEQFLARGADANVRGVTYRDSALSSALVNGYSAVVKKLLDAGALVDPYEMQIARAYKNQEIIAMLEKAARDAAPAIVS